MKYLKNVSTIILNSEKCNNCMTCLDVCPHSVFQVSSKKVFIADKDSCMDCGACALNCKCGAITVNAGVGCASALIRGILTGAPPTCDSDCC